MALPRRVAQRLVSLNHTQTRAYSEASQKWVEPRHTLHVTPFEGFKSMTHVFATARELEKRFGPIENIQVPHDPETNKYRGYAWLTFREQLPKTDDGAFPKEFHNIMVKKPANDVNRPGGPGLDDFAGLLDAGSVKPESEWTKVSDAKDQPSAYLDVRVDFASFARFYKKTRVKPLEPERKVAIAKAFATFQGYAPEPTPLMQEVVKKWSKHIPPGWEPPQDTRIKKVEEVEETAADAELSEIDAQEAAQVDPLADYLEVYKDVKPEDPQGSYQSKTAKVDPPQSTGRPSPTERLSTPLRNDAATNNWYAAAESLSFSEAIPPVAPVNPPPAPAKPKVKVVKKPVEPPRPAKPTKKELLLAAARKVGKKAQEDKAKAKSDKSKPVEEPASQSEVEASPIEPSASQKSGIFSMFKF